MQTSTRRIIYYFYLFLFFTISPALALYTAGYRLNTNTWSVRRVGVLVVDSKPEKATVRLNNEIQDEATPARINALFPQDYNLSVIKDGYHSWDKEITINPSATTFVQDIFLYRQAEPLPLIENNPQLVTVSPDKRYLAYTEKNKKIWQLLVYDSEKSEFLVLIASSAVPIIDIQWAPSSLKLLITKQHPEQLTHEIIPLLQPLDNIRLEKFLKPPLKEVKWDSRDDAFLYALQTDQLVRLRVLPEEVTPLLTETKISQYFLYNGSLITLQPASTPSSTLATTYNFKAGAFEARSTFSLPAAEEFRFLNGPNDFLTLLDEEHQILYFIQPDDEVAPVKKSVFGVHSAQWAEDRQNLVYATPFELWVYHADTKEHELISRFSQPLNAVLWHTTSSLFTTRFEHLFFVLGDQLKAIELDPQPPKNITELAELPAIRPLSLTADRKKLYLISTQNKQTKLYSLKLQ